MNIVDVGTRVNAKVDHLLNTLPVGITLTPIYDQAAVVDESVDGFIANLVMSVVVVTLTLCLFMGWRSGVVVGAVLLVTVLGTILIMWLMDIQLQRISLGAMVIAMDPIVAPGWQPATIRARAATRVPAGLAVRAAVPDS